jgi:hypothetical protein
MSSRVCGFGSLLRRCKALGTASCVFCGNRFCPEHGQRVEASFDVCARPRCEQKLEDQRGHERYRQQVEQKNRFGLCGVDACETRYEDTCSRCQRYFCDQHISVRDYPPTRQSAGGPASVCAHCWLRRKLWAY